MRLEQIGSFSASSVTEAVEYLSAQEANPRRSWLAAVAKLVADERPDLSPQVIDFLGVTPLARNVLADKSIGGIGVVYEALLAHSDRMSRKDNGQFFTPDDVAKFMASASAVFPMGRWLDPCSGVGNLSLHLALAQPDPESFVRDRLSLVDMDETALKTAVVLLVAATAPTGDENTLLRVWNRCQVRDFLSEDSLPAHDYVIVNPPYGRAAQRDVGLTGKTGELYAYFLERVVKESQGFISVTPASFMSGAKFAPVRALLAQRPGGRSYVFDNAPDTLFRGYKFGSTNTSKTNFVRAAITVSSPLDARWAVTPIIRWSHRSRARMFSVVEDFLVPLRVGPNGEWVKLMPGTEELWDALIDTSETLGDLTVSGPTPYRLDVASTPRYYISASLRALDRGSKHVLYFATPEDRDRAYVVLNSSLPFWWYRSLDGGITVPSRVLASMPIPARTVEPEVVSEVQASEAISLTTKMNAGRANENIKHERSLVERLDGLLFGKVKYDLQHVYQSDMFALAG